MAKIKKTFPVKSRGVGLPDYSQPKPVGQVPVGPVFTSTDVAELAVRLGSIVNFDRRGNVFSFDDFETPILKFRTFTNVGCSVTLDTAQARSGGQSCKLFTPTSTPPSSRAATLSRALPIPASEQVGIEISWHSKLYRSEIEFYTSWYDGATEYFAAIKFSLIVPSILPGLAKIYLYTQSGYVELAERLFWSPLDFAFRTLKLVADFDTGKYIRLLFDREEFDISDKFLWSSPSTFHPQIETTFALKSSLEFGDTCWVDDFILTQNEPPNT